MYTELGISQNNNESPGLQLVRAGWDMASGTLEDDFSGFSAPLAHIYPSSDPVEGECYMCPLYIDEVLYWEDR